MVGRICQICGVSSQDVEYRHIAWTAILSVYRQDRGSFLPGGPGWQLAYNQAQMAIQAEKDAHYRQWYRELSSGRPSRNETETPGKSDRRAMLPTGKTVFVSETFSLSCRTICGKWQKNLSKRKSWRRSVPIFAGVLSIPPLSFLSSTRQSSNMRHCEKSPCAGAFLCNTHFKVCVVLPFASVITVGRSSTSSGTDLSG